MTGDALLVGTKGGCRSRDGGESWQDHLPTVLCVEVLQ